MKIQDAARPPSLPNQPARKLAAAHADHFQPESRSGWSDSLRHLAVKIGKSSLLCAAAASAPLLGQALTGSPVGALAGIAAASVGTGIAVGANALIEKDPEPAVLAEAGLGVGAALGVIGCLGPMAVGAMAAMGCGHALFSSFLEATNG